MLLSDLDRALLQWSTVVGPENLITDETRRRAAERTTFAVARRVPAILRPADRSQVQECLRIANRFRVPVYPVSRGKNWGYGSRAPSADDCVLLELGRLNRIVDFSEELAYVTVEPGVTQAQLHEFLLERRSRLWMDATGASPDSSLIGNTVERGFGHTPYGDHLAHSCGFEVVLPTGDVIETGFGRFCGAQAAALDRWGLGPALEGLFTQSNFGVVTRMTSWLMPAPEYFQAFCFRCDAGEDLPALIDALRPLRLDGTLRSTLHLANDYKVLSGLQQYPWTETAGQTPLSGAMMRRLRDKLRIGAWNGSGGLYGTRAQVAEARRLVRRALKGKVSRLQFLDDRMLRFASLFAGVYGRISGWDLSRTLALLRPVYGLMKGVPTAHPLASTYWRKRTPPPSDMDPDRDGCGLLWCSPVIPAEGGHARRVTGLASQLMLAHGFEPIITLTLISDRTLACILSISYDRDRPGEDERASQCCRELLEALAARGYYSYRLGIHSMQSAMRQDAYGNLLAAVKEALDPNGILAPGRYLPDARRVAPQDHTTSRRAATSLT